MTLPKDTANMCREIKRQSGEAGERNAVGLDACKKRHNSSNNSSFNPYRLAIKRGKHEAAEKTVKSSA